MNLIYYINQVYLIRLLNLLLNNSTKLIIKLLNQDLIRRWVHIFNLSFINILLYFHISFDSVDLLLTLLVLGGLMEHKKSGFFVSGGHDFWSVVDGWFEKRFSIVISHFRSSKALRWIKERHSASTHIANVAVRPR